MANHHLERVGEAILVPQPGTVCVFPPTDSKVGARRAIYPVPKLRQPDVD